MFMAKKIKYQEEILKEIEDKLSATEYERQAYQRQWFLNIAYLAGKHYVKYNEALRKLIEIRDVPSWRVRMVVNILAQHFQTRLAKLLKARPICNVMPASQERRDELAAQVGQTVLEYYDGELNTPQTHTRMWSWVLSCGTAFKHPYWEEDLIIDVVSPFEMVFDPTASRVEDAHWCIRTRTYKPEVLKEKFDLKEIEASEEEMPYGVIEQQLVNLMLKTPFKVESETEKCVTVHELWEKPSKEYPRGRHIIATKSEILASEDIPKEYEGELPFIKYDDLQLPGRFYGRSFLEDILPLVKELDRILSQIIEAKNLMSKPKWLIPVQSGLSDDALTSEPGEKIKYNPGGKPEAWSPHVITPELFNLVELIIHLIQDVSGQHEVTKAQVPTGVTSGRAISFLQEQDDSRLQPILYNFESSYERECKMILNIVKTRMSEKKTVSIIGKHKKHEVLEWKKADLQGEWTVKVQAGSAYPRYKVTWQSYILDIFKLGIIQDPDKILKLLEIPEARDEIGLDESQAAIENDRMAEVKSEKDERQYPEQWHNHIIHLRVHNELRKGQEWDELSDTAKNHINAHCALHEQMVKKQIAEMQSLQNPQQGGETPVPQNRPTVPQQRTEPMPVGMEQ